MNLSEYIVYALALGASAGIIWGSIERAGRKAALRTLALNTLLVAAIEESHALINGPKTNGHAPVEDTRTPYVPADTDPRMHVS